MPPPSPAPGLAHVATTAAAPDNAYQTTPACSDRTQRCANRNGIWPPRYERQWEPHPPHPMSALGKTAQRQFIRCVLDAVAAGELHRTTGNVLLAFARASDDLLTDPWIAQATVGQRLGLAASTVCHHVTVAKRLGWVAVQHRNRIDNGFVVGMSNITRLMLPKHWHDRLDEQRRHAQAERTARRRRGGGRATPAAVGRADRGPVVRPVRWSEVNQAASTGAAKAWSASTTSFEQGRLELEAEFHGQPAHLYESAYDAFVEKWKTVRQNE